MQRDQPEDHDAAWQAIVANYGERAEVDERPGPGAEPLGLTPMAVIPFDPQLFGNASNNGRMLGEMDAQHAIVQTLNDFVSDTPEFRGADALLIDDVHFLGEKERTQEEFFHTFNALHEADKPIVVSSDKYPQDLQRMPERLISRFTSAGVPVYLLGQGLGPYKGKLAFPWGHGVVFTRITADSDAPGKGHWDGILFLPDSPGMTPHAWVPCPLHD